MRLFLRKKIKKKFHILKFFVYWLTHIECYTHRSGYWFVVLNIKTIMLQRQQLSLCHHTLCRCSCTFYAFKPMNYNKILSRMYLENEFYVCTERGLLNNTISFSHFIFSVVEEIMPLIQEMKKFHKDISKISHPSNIGYSFYPSCY